MMGIMVVAAILSAIRGRVGTPGAEPARAARPRSRAATAVHEPPLRGK